MLKKWILSFKLNTQSKVQPPVRGTLNLMLFKKFDLFHQFTKLKYVRQDH